MLIRGGKKVGMIQGTDIHYSKDKCGSYFIEPGSFVNSFWEIKSDDDDEPELIKYYVKYGDDEPSVLHGFTVVSATNNFTVKAVKVVADPSGDSFPHVITVKMTVSDGVVTEAFVE